MPKERYRPSRGIRLSKTVSPTLLTKICAQLGKNTHSNTRHRVGTGNIKTVEGASDAINSKGGKNVKTDTQKKKKKKNNTRIPGCVSQIAPLLRERKKEKKDSAFVFAKRVHPRSPEQQNNSRHGGETRGIADRAKTKDNNAQTSRAAVV